VKNYHHSSYVVVVRVHTLETTTKIATASVADSHRANSDKSQGATHLGAYNDVTTAGKINQWDSTDLMSQKSCSAGTSASRRNGTTA
jgi:hypothetical protein